jgi:hypothetical protein
MRMCECLGMAMGICMRVCTPEKRLKKRDKNCKTTLVEKEIHSWKETGMAIFITISMHI